MTQCSGVAPWHVFNFLDNNGGLHYEGLWNIRLFMHTQYLQVGSHMHMRFFDNLEWISGCIYVLCISWQPLIRSALRLAGILLRTQESAVSIVMICRWVVLEKFVKLPHKQRWWDYISSDNDLKKFKTLKLCYWTVYCEQLQLCQTGFEWSLEFVSIYSHLFTSLCTVCTVQTVNFTLGGCVAGNPKTVSFEFGAIWTHDTLNK